MRNYESGTRQTNRIARLERRLRQLVAVPYKSPSQRAEISALEWAIPILEQYIIDNYGELVIRKAWHKHEKRIIRDKLWERDGDICYLCYKPMEKIEATIDHVIPLCRNGKDDESNYKLAHEPCNVEKGNMLLEDYRAWQQGRKKLSVHDNLAQRGAGQSEVAQAT